MKRQLSLLPLTEEKALDDKQLSQNQIDSMSDLLRIPQQQVIEVVTLDSPPHRDTDSPIAVYQSCLQFPMTYWYPLSN
jgi:hypothetical protein